MLLKLQCKFMFALSKLFYPFYVAYTVSVLLYHAAVICSDLFFIV